MNSLGCVLLPQVFKPNALAGQGNCWLLINPTKVVVALGALGRHWELKNLPWRRVVCTIRIMLNQPTSYHSSSLTGWLPYSGRT